MNDFEINIGKDFSSTPSGRYYIDMTESSGEQFREELLWPTLKELKGSQRIKIILDDDVEGYGSSFLVEGFAGIVKYGYMDKADLINKLLLIQNDPDFDLFKKKILQYINEAVFNSKRYESTKPEYLEKIKRRKEHTK
ncbi:STAS-like domain-containing protein [Citrobacter sp. BDA59-3]|uniref:STAS-like domain-containing protein n=1 Tax=Citrobacter sp. BDA59-3 TaxID=2781952 RepID=UPI0018812CE6|nr:DUF4325 domain-containing protein [Citrobacter sp. BDA59-3]QOV67788.1 STAS-like domain-containing protein [Citrobacter sp. BDA59-3]